MAALYAPILSVTPPTSGNSKQLWSPELFDDQTGGYPIDPLPAVPFTYPRNGSDQVQYFDGFQSVATPVGSFLASNADQLLLDSTAAWEPDSATITNTIQALRSNRVALESAKWATSLISMVGRMQKRDTIYSGPPGVDYHYEEVVPAVVLPSTTVLIGSDTYTVTTVLWTEPSPLTNAHVHHWGGGTPPPVYLVSDTILNQVVALQLTPIGGSPADLNTILSPGDIVSFV